MGMCVPSTAPIDYGNALVYKHINNTLKTIFTGNLNVIRQENSD